MTSKEKAFWKTWQPTARTTLCFIFRGEEVLLIRKKRGIGAGKVNAPGGHLEPGESAFEAAIREVEEEVRVVPYGLKRMGELSFQFIDKKTWLPEMIENDISGAQHCVVFAAQGCIGEPQETEEAIPFWSHHTQIPFDEMWADDREWIPGMLAQVFQLELPGSARNEFSGYYFFDQDDLLSGHLEWS